MNFFKAHFGEMRHHSSWSAVFSYISPEKPRGFFLLHRLWYQGGTGIMEQFLGKYLSMLFWYWTVVELLVFSNAFRTFPRILAKRFSSLRQLDMVKIQIPEVEIRDSIALSAVASSASLKFEVHLSPPVGAGTEAIPLYCSSCCRVYRLSNWCISKGQQNLLRYRWVNQIAITSKWWHNLQVLQSPT